MTSSRRTIKATDQEFDKAFYPYASVLPKLERGYSILTQRGDIGDEGLKQRGHSCSQLNAGDFIGSGLRVVTEGGAMAVLQNPDPEGASAIPQEIYRDLVSKQETPEELQYRLAVSSQRKTSHGAKGRRALVLSHQRNRFVI